MNYCFTDLNFDTKQLEKSSDGSISNFLLENNVKQVEQIYEFFEKETPLLLINGFLGTGKSSILNHTVSCLSKEVVFLEYNCFETTILDDILLEFFEEFKKLSAVGKVKIPKVKSDNFIQKINSYFQSMEKPVVVVINSFEEILKNNRQEIMNFIFHISSFSNVKVVLVSRNFDISEFEGRVQYSKVTVLALEKSVFERYLRANDIKQIGPMSDELYKLTRGYFFYTTLAMKIMKLRNLKLIDFLDGYSKSFLTFNDFILREGLSLIDPVSGHLFRFLTVMRHPVNVKLLKNLHLWNEEKAEFFIQNLVLSRYENYVYLQNYYKEIAENSIPENIAVKLHQGCIDLYNTQLPLKPLERDLLISRQTMRNEIEYHSMFIPKRPTIPQKEVVQPELIQNTPDEVQAIETKEQKDEKIKNMSFIFEDDKTGVLDKIADSIKGFVINRDKEKEEDLAENKMSLTQLINKAKHEEVKFEYARAISVYLKALSQNNDDDYYTLLPLIYTKLAQNYQKLSNWFDARKYFELAEEFYASAGDTEKSLEMKYNVANIYYMTFKREMAKDILVNVEKQTTSNELRIKSLVLLASLTSDSELACDYYEKALAVDFSDTDKNVLSELYFKYAVICEDIGNEKTAFEFYKKCITLDLKSNPNLAPAFSNIAQMYDDAGKTELALKYFNESLRIYESVQNLNGIYSSYMKLAEIYSINDKDKAIECYEKSMNCAKVLDEAFYILSTSIALGDFYFNRNENELAMENYKIGLKYATNEENKEKILLRIEDIKMRIGEERFNRLEK